MAAAGTRPDTKPETQKECWAGAGPQPFWVYIYMSQCNQVPVEPEHSETYIINRFRSLQNGKTQKGVISKHEHVHPQVYLKCRRITNLDAISVRCQKNGKDVQRISVQEELRN